MGAGNRTRGNKDRTEGGTVRMQGIHSFDAEVHDSALGVVSRSQRRLREMSNPVVLPT